MCNNVYTWYRFLDRFLFFPDFPNKVRNTEMRMLLYIWSLCPCSSTGDNGKGGGKKKFGRFFKKKFVGGKASQVKTPY